MKTTRSLYLAVVFATAFISCSKDDDEKKEPNIIEGTYDFISMTAHTNSTLTQITATNTDKTVATSDYETINNSGTVTIDARNFAAKNMSYTVDTVAQGSFYTDDVLQLTTPMAFEVTIPGVNRVSAYKLVGTDSVYFEAGFINPPDINSSPATDQGAGARISWAGDTLLVHTIASFTYTSDDVTYDNQFSQVIKLKKK